MRINESVSGKNITNFVLKFLEFINKSGVCVDDLMVAHDWDNDGFFSIHWMQANWKFLIENEFLSEKDCITPFSILVNEKFIVENKKSLYCVFVEWRGDIKDMKSNVIIEKSDKYRLLSFTNVTDLNPPYKFAEIYCDRIKNRFAVEVDKVDFIMAPFDRNQMEIS